MYKWMKRDKKIKARQRVKTFNKRVADYEPRKRKNRYRSREDMEWELHDKEDFNAEDS